MRIMFILLFLLSPAFTYSQGAERDPFKPLLPQIQEKKRSRDTVLGRKDSRRNSVVIPEKKKEEVDPSLPRINIEGILWGTDKPLALIDGVIYKPGDIINGIDAMLYKIERNNIFVFYKGKAYRIGITK